MFEVVSQDTQFRQFLRSMFGIRLSYRALYYQAQLQSSVLTVRTDRAKHPELTVHNRIVPAPSAPDLRSTWARVNGLKTSSSSHGAPEKTKRNELRGWFLEDIYYRQI